MWRVESGQLWPIVMAQGGPWPLAWPMEARCAASACAQSHDFTPAPGGRGSGCGLWAFRERRIDGLQPSVILGLSEGDHAFGRVKLWGRVMPFEHGWRAQFARPISLYRLWPEHREDEFSVVAAGYGVPIEDAPLELIDRVSWWSETLRSYRTATAEAMLYAQMIGTSQHGMGGPSQHGSYFPPLSPIAFASPPPARRWPLARRWFIFWCVGAGMNAVGVLDHALEGGIRWWNLGALVGCLLATRNWWRRWKGSSTT